MPDFWLDTNCFIEPSNGPYAFDLVPQFWDFLDAQSKTGTISSPIMVFNELHDETVGELHAWAGARRNMGLFAEATAEVQAAFKEVADFVVANYPPEQATEFLDGADPWLVAHARAQGGLIVTHEALVGQGAKKPKIPNICQAFGLEPPIKVWEMLRRLGFRVT